VAQDIHSASHAKNLVPDSKSPKVDKPPSPIGKTFPKMSKPPSPEVSYPIFMPKQSTHCMYDPGSIVPHIRPKVFTDNQMSRIKYNYYINSVSKVYDDSQWNRTAEDSITPQERQPGQHVALNSSSKNSSASSPFEKQV
jgi:hypothetical protein